MTKFRDFPLRVILVTQQVYMCNVFREFNWGVNKTWTGSDRIGLTKPGPDRTGLTKPGSDCVRLTKPGPDPKKVGLS